MKKRLQILIVEDVDEMRDLLQCVIEGVEEFQVSGLARCGSEARLEVSRRRPDLILLDEILPGESSRDLIDEFSLLNIPIILITSLQNPTHSLPDKVCTRMVKPGWKSLAEDRLRIKEVIRLHSKSNSSS